MYLKYLIHTKILLGIGIGMIIGVISMIGYKYNISISDAEIEKKALDLGMIYKDESKIGQGSKETYDNKSSNGDEGENGDEGND